MSDKAQQARIELLLGELRLPTVKRIYEKVGREVSTAGGDFLAYLMVLLEEEVHDRCTRRVQRRLKEARFRQVKHLSELDAASLPKTITMDLLNELAAGHYMKNASNVIAVGNSGTGKTHVGTALAVAACHQGKSRRCLSVGPCRSLAS